MKKEIKIEHSADFIEQCMAMSFAKLNQQLVDHCLTQDLQLAHTYNGQELDNIDGIELKQVSYKKWSLRLDNCKDLAGKLMLESLKLKLANDSIPAEDVDKKIWSDHWVARNAIETPKMMVQRMNKAMTGSENGTQEAKKGLEAPCHSKASLFQQFSSLAITFELKKENIDAMTNKQERAILVK